MTSEKEKEGKKERKKTKKKQSIEPWFIQQRPWLLRNKLNSTDPFQNKLLYSGCSSCSILGLQHITSTYSYGVLRMSWSNAHLVGHLADHTSHFGIQPFHCSISQCQSTWEWKKAYNSDKAWIVWRHLIGMSSWMWWQTFYSGALLSIPTKMHNEI